MQRIASALLTVGLILGQVSGYNGEMPKQPSYNYTYYGETTSAPEAYEFSTSFGGQELGIENLTALSDICCDDNQYVYLCDRDSGRIIKVNSDFSLVLCKSEFVFENKSLKFNQPEGLCYGNDGYLYVADTANGRIVKLTTDFEVVSVIGAPSKEEAQYDFEYMPYKLSVDARGRIYAVVKGQTQGIFQFNSQGKFLGYIGASKVKTNAKQMLYRLFASREQLKGMMRFIPTEYNNICIDKDGFIYGTISAIETGTVLSDIEKHTNNAKMVRKMNQSGKDISVTKGNQAPLGDLSFTYGVTNIYVGPSSFVDVAVYDSGVYSVLDSKRGRIFTYNSQSEFMYLFGSRGNGKNSFQNAVALTYLGDSILVADQFDGTVHVFNQTDYAQLIMSANDCYVSGDYEQEEKIWSKLLVLYPGSDLGLVGMGRALYKQGKYAESLSYFKKSQNREYYSKALLYYIRGLGIKYSPYIISVILVLAIVIIILSKKRKKKVEEIKSKSRFKQLIKEVKYGLYIIFHPFDGFWDLKAEKRGSTLSATCILVLSMIVNIIYIRLTPFLFNDTDFSSKSALLSGAGSILAMVALWTLCNWALTTIMNGKGTIRDIYKYSCYSLTPIIIVYPILLIASYLLTIESSSILTIISAIALAWVIFLLFCGTTVTHQYSGLKSIITMIFTVVGIMIILFVLLLSFSLVQQIITFVELLLREVTLAS